MSRYDQPDCSVSSKLGVNIRVMGEQNDHGPPIQATQGLVRTCRSFPEIVHSGHRQAMIQGNVLVIKYDIRNP
jgi:hypothetical protein